MPSSSARPSAPARSRKSRANLRRCRSRTPFGLVPRARPGSLRAGVATRTTRDGRVRERARGGRDRGEGAPARRPESPRPRPGPDAIDVQQPRRASVQQRARRPLLLTTPTPPPASVPAGAVRRALGGLRRVPVDARGLAARPGDDALGRGPRDGRRAGRGRVPPPPAPRGAHPPPRPAGGEARSRRLRRRPADARDAPPPAYAEPPSPPTPPALPDARRSPRRPSPRPPRARTRDPSTPPSTPASTSSGGPTRRSAWRTTTLKPTTTRRVRTWIRPPRRRARYRSRGTRR